MKTNSAYTIQLANGRERTFESAAQMVEWMERQLGPHGPRRGWQSTPERKPGGSSSHRDTRKPRDDGKPQRIIPRGHQAEPHAAPLSRYTNRNGIVASTACR